METEWNIKRSIRLYLKCISAVLQGAMQYKLSFLLMIMGRFLIAFSGFAAIFLLFSEFTDIKGYSYSDVLLCFSIIQMSFGITECIGRGFESFSGIIKQGEFDRMLLRPVSPILQVLGTRFELGKIGPVLTGVIMLAVGIGKSQVVWNAGRIITLFLMLAGGVCLFLGLFLIGAGTCFFTIEDMSFINILTYGGREHGKYPFDIYGKQVMRFCTYIVPYTLIQYYPLQYLLGKTDRWQYGLYPFGAAVFLAVCYAFWRYGMRHYQSTGN